MPTNKSKAVWFRSMVVSGVAVLILIGGLANPGQALDDPVSYYSQWSRGVPADPNFFPIAVWLQQSWHAAEYKAIGINTYVGLAGGSASSNLAQLKAAGIKVLYEQDSTSLGFVGNTTIAGWIQSDEMDNAQLPGGSWGLCYEPSVVQANYQTWKTNDPTRPVYMGFGMGAALTTWYGRGDCTGHTEMYPEYIKGTDIIGFDIYPLNGKGTQPTDIFGQLYWPSVGVDNLRAWSGDAKPIWPWIETTKIDISSQNVQPTPAQVKSEVWMSLIHGALGIGYFCHVFDNGAYVTDVGPLQNPTMSAGLTAINAQITSLAPVLNSTTIKNWATVASSNPAVPIDIMVKNFGGAQYLFAAAMRPGASTATFAVPAGATVNVLGESRTLTVTAGHFSDAFAADYSVHLYQISGINDTFPPAPPRNLRVM